MGVWTFYPGPDREGAPKQQEIQKLYREQERLDMKRGPGSLDATQQAEYDQRQKQIDRLNSEMQKMRNAWAVNTSIILLTFATILMAISLFLPDAMRVFSNGVLLGGLFSVLYGTGWSFAGGNSKARFFVVLVALLLSVAFGYLRFIRGKHAKAEAALEAGTAAGAAAIAGPEMTGLEARVAAIEERLSAVASALGRGRE